MARSKMIAAAAAAALAGAWIAPAGAQAVDEVVVVTDGSVSPDEAAAVAWLAEQAEVQREVQQHQQQEQQRRHLRHGGHRAQAAPGHRHHHHQHQRRHMTEQELEQELEQEPPQRPHSSASLAEAGALSSPVYPVAHPMVGRALDGMGSDVGEVQNRFTEAGAQREQLETAVDGALTGIRDGSKFRRAMASKQADVYVQQRMAKQLEVEGQHLREQHEKVAAHLRALMEPAVAKRAKQVEQEQSIVEKSESELQRWLKLRDSYKAAALESLVQRKKTLEVLGEAQAAAKEAERQEAQAKEAYAESQDQVARRIEQYRMSIAKSQAAQSSVSEASADLDEKKHSLERTQQVYSSESQRLEQSLDVSEKRLKQREEKVESEIAQDRAQYTQAQQSYAAWQAEQKQHAQDVAQHRVTYEEKQKEFDASRGKVLSAASDAAGQQAQHDSDFDDSDWAWSENGELGPDGEALEEVSLGSA